MQKGVWFPHTQILAVCNFDECVVLLASWGLLSSMSVCLQEEWGMILRSLTLEQCGYLNKWYLWDNPRLWESNTRRVSCWIAWRRWISNTVVRIALSLTIAAGRAFRFGYLQLIQPRCRAIPLSRGTEEQRMLQSVGTADERLFESEPLNLAQVEIKFRYIPGGRLHPVGFRRQVRIFQRRFPFLWRWNSLILKPTIDIDTLEYLDAFSSLFPCRIASRANTTSLTIPHVRRSWHFTTSVSSADNRFCHLAFLFVSV